MPYQSINYYTQDTTTGFTILALAFAIVLVLFGIALMLAFMRTYKKRAAARLYYLENVIAFKVGYIHKHATDAGIDLKPPPKSDLMASLEEEVSKDLNTAD